MHRRSFLRQSTLAVGATLLPWQRDLLSLFTADEAQMYLLRNNVGVFLERGGTIAWLVEPDGLAVADTQFPEQAGHLIDRIREKTDRRVDLLLNTHHHGDHSSGNIAFKDIADKVVAHENSKANQMRVAKERGTENQQLYPDTTFTDQWSQKVGSETITLRYFGPAHTNGDAVIHFENANVAHVGDLLFNRRFPYIDRSAGASIANWIEVLRAIRKTYDKDTLFVCGHAREGLDITADHKDLKAFEQYLKKLLSFVKKERKAGKDVAAMLASTETIPGAPEWQGGGLERNLQAAFEELAEDGK